MKDLRARDHRDLDITTEENSSVSTECTPTPLLWYKLWLPHILLGTLTLVTATWAIARVSGLGSGLLDSTYYRIGVLAIGAVIAVNVVQKTVNTKTYATINLAIACISIIIALIVTPIWQHYHPGIEFGVKQIMDSKTRPGIVMESHKFNNKKGDIFFPASFGFMKGDVIVVKVDFAPVEYYRGKDKEGKNIWETINPNINNPLKEKWLYGKKPVFRDKGNYALVTVYRE